MPAAAQGERRGRGWRAEKGAGASCISRSRPCPRLTDREGCRRQLPVIRQPAERSAALSEGRGPAPHLGAGNRRGGVRSGRIITPSSHPRPDRFAGCIQPSGEADIRILHLPPREPPQKQRARQNAAGLKALAWRRKRPALPIKKSRRKKNRGPEGPRRRALEEARASRPPHRPARAHHTSDRTPPASQGPRRNQRRRRQRRRRKRPPPPREKESAKPTDREKHEHASPEAKSEEQRAKETESEESNHETPPSEKERSGQASPQRPGSAAAGHPPAAREGNAPREARRVADGARRVPQHEHGEDGEDRSEARTGAARSRAQMLGPPRAGGLPAR